MSQRRTVLPSEPTLDRLRATNESLLVHRPAEPIAARIRTKEGRYVWMETSTRPLIENGTISEIHASGRDVTARKELKARLLQSQKMEAVGRLAGGIAHDFNNMLVVISGYSRLLQQCESLDDLARQRVDRIEEASLRAAALTDQLLSFSRQKVRIPRRVDLNAEVEGMATLLRAVHLGGARFSRRCRADSRRHGSWDGRGDARTRLRSVLHHEGGRPGHRARVGDSLRDRRGERRPSPRTLRRRTRPRPRGGVRRLLPPGDRIGTTPARLRPPPATAS